MATSRVGRWSLVIWLIATALVSPGCGLFTSGRDVGDTYTYETTDPPPPGAPGDPATQDPRAAAIEVVLLTEPGRTSLRITGSGFGDEDVIGLTLDGLAAGLARADGSGPSPPRFPYRAATPRSGRSGHRPTQRPYRHRARHGLTGPAAVTPCSR
jgi:hypothetical protein